MGKKRKAHYPHSHYQTAKTLTIEISVEGITTSETTHRFKPNEIFVQIEREDPAEVYTFEMIPFAEINPSKCKCIIKGDKVQLKIRKVEAKEWEVIFQKRVRKPASDSAQPQRLQAKPSNTLPKAYATQRDWDEVERNLTKELEEEKPKEEAVRQK